MSSRLDPKQLADDEISHPSAPNISSAQIRLAAMDLLARREQSQSELASKLKRKFISKQFSPQSFSSQPFNSQQHGKADHLSLDAVIDDVIEQLQRENLQNDERYTEAFIHYHRERGRGPRKIRNELMAKGVSENVINELLDEGDRRWLCAIKQLSEKKYSRSAITKQELAKRFRFFQGRGFTTEQIQSVLNNSAV